MARVALDFLLLFEAVPGLYLVLAPDRELTILGASDAYLRATMTARDAIVGKPLFEVFPDNPNDPAAPGVRSLADSIARAIATRAPDAIDTLQHDARRPDGTCEQRARSPVITPALDSTPTIRYFIH